MAGKLNLVLLIDDNEDDIFFHRRAIESSGLVASIDICVDGSDALDYLQNRGKYKETRNSYPQPDIIFLDMNMPRTNGWGFLQEYALLDKCFIGGPIVIMLSTSLNPVDKRKVEQSSLVQDFMTKPLKKQTFLEILEKHFPAVVKAE